MPAKATISLILNSFISEYSYATPFGQKMYPGFIFQKYLNLILFKYYIYLPI